MPDMNTRTVRPVRGSVVTLDGTVIEYDLAEGDPVEHPAVAGHLVGLGHASVFDGRPAQSETKDVWVAFRAAQGHDVAGLTKQALIDLDDPADAPTDLTADTANDSPADADGGGDSAEEA